VGFLVPDNSIRTLKEQKGKKEVKYFQSQEESWKDAEKRPPQSNRSNRTFSSERQQEHGGLKESVPPRKEDRANGKDHDWEWTGLTLSQEQKKEEEMGEKGDVGGDRNSLRDLGRKRLD